MIFFRGVMIAVIFRYLGGGFKLFFMFQANFVAGNQGSLIPKN